MKTKLKKWHVILMSFVALVFAIFTSLFNLKADPVDDETGEILTDNWELGIVFYDSTVDNGKTPLTEINWDASHLLHSDTETRIITVQINYKNNSAVTTYAPGELEISIPNLIYQDSISMWDENLHESVIITPYASEKANWTASAVVGANDSTHEGYDWDFVSGTSPTRSQSCFQFKNANTIEEKSNFEGSIQIQYTIKTIAETKSNIEFYLNQCLHEYSKTLVATLTQQKDVSELEEVITSPNWPSSYPYNMKEEENTWEYSVENAKAIVLVFDPTSSLGKWDHIKMYNKDGDRLYDIYEPYSPLDKTKNYIIEGNYVKITMNSDDSYTGKGFKLYYQEPIVSSNIINFNFSRTYNHPWEREAYTLTKEATKINSYDGLGANCEDYIWVKYKFRINHPHTNNNGIFPYIHAENYIIKDSLPEGCIVYDSKSNLLSPINNEYNFIIPDDSKSFQWAYFDEYFYIGYPKSLYNENLGNLVITNHATLYADYRNGDKNIYQDDAEVSLNLADFEFNYSGDLYTLYKQNNSSGNLYYQSLTEGTQINSSYNYTANYRIQMKSRYTGKIYDLKIGDDLVFVTDVNNNYRKLTDDEYYFSSISFPKLYNGNNDIIDKKYDVDLYVRYANTLEYVKYGSTFKNENKSFSFSTNNKVVGFYFIIHNVSTDINSNTHNSEIYAYITFTKLKNIANTGRIYNFAYLQVVSNNEILNEPTIDSYANFITKEEIATFDQETYGHYMQRAWTSNNYSYYSPPALNFSSYVNKTMSAVIQDEAHKKFKGTCRIYSYYSGGQNPNAYIPFIETETLDPNQSVTGFQFFDLLPEGMSLTSSKEEMINSITTSFYAVYNINKQQLTENEINELIKNNASFNIIENWNNTSRTWINLNIDLSNTPFYIFGTNTSFNPISFNYNYEISYDAYLEQGSVWKNNVYMDVLGKAGLLYSTKDNGSNDLDEYDINNNQDIEEILSFKSASITIPYLISTHQDVTTFVKTNQSNYSTGIVDASNNSEYEYKLRVRTGAADVTNLIIYTNLEEAQPDKTRWKGEFIDINTSYAKSKGYTVKPYYSENTAAGNLYNEDGTLNADWKEYMPDTPEIVANGLSITFNSQSQTENNCDYVIIYYRKDGKTYQTQKLMGTNIAGKTVTIPSTDFYLYWYTDGSVCSYYGFSIDSIVPSLVENVTDTTGTIPSYTATELRDNNYPDSTFESYSHGNYGNNIRKLWHYTYTDSLILQERQEHIDKTKVKSLAFEYLNSEGNPAILPANSLTYVLIQMKSPADENIKTLARMDCWTQWNALDDYDRPVDFITGINSNVVKVALPKSIKTDDLPSISLRFIKEIQGTDSEFKNIKLDKADQQIFKIRLTSLVENEDGTYNQLTALLKSDQELIISQIPVGSYLLEELGDNYFDFVDFTNNNDPEIIIEGVTLEKTLMGYILTVSEDLSETIEFNIKVTNEIEDERFYEYKDHKENLFFKNKINDNIMNPDDPQGH